MKKQSNTITINQYTKSMKSTKNDQVTWQEYLQREWFQKTWKNVSLNKVSFYATSLSFAPSLYCKYE